MENKDIINTIEHVAWLCHKTATDKGFYDEHLKILDTLMSLAPDTPTDASLQSEHDNYIAFGEVLGWYRSTVEQAAIARMHSELSEWVEGIRDRNNSRDKHCPEFLSAEIEAADVIIRVLDMCNYRGYRIGQAIIAKMTYNLLRPRKHGKNS